MTSRIKQTVPVLAVSLAVAVVVFLILSDRIVVTVENIGTKAISDVEVQIGGATYPLGVIEPGTKQRVKITFESESDIGVSWTDSEGKNHLHRVDVYITRETEGSALLLIRDAEFEDSVLELKESLF